MRWLQMTSKKGKSYEKQRNAIDKCLQYYGNDMGSYHGDIDNISGKVWSL